MYSVYICCFWNENYIYFWSESCKKGNKEWGGGGMLNKSLIKLLNL